MTFVIDHSSSSEIFLQTIQFTVNIAVGDNSISSAALATIHPLRYAKEWSASG